MSVASMGKEELFKVDDIRKVVNVIKPLDKSWAKNLAIEMNKEDKDISEQSIYDIVHNRLRTQNIRMAFIRAAKRHMDHLKEEQEKVKDQLKSILE